MTLAHKTELYTCMYAQNPILTIHQAFGAFFSHFLKASAPYFISAISAFIHQKLYDVKCRNLLFMNKMVYDLHSVQLQKFGKCATALVYSYWIPSHCNMSCFCIHCLYLQVNIRTDPRSWAHYWKNVQISRWREVDLHLSTCIYIYGR